MSSGRFNGLDDSDGGQEILARGPMRTCLYNVDPGASPELLAAIKRLSFVRFVGEANSPEVLAQYLKDGVVNLILVHLDPDPSVALEVVDELSMLFPDLGLIAISYQTDPAAILAPIRAGCDQYVCKPINLNEFASAVWRVAGRKRLSDTRGQSVCVASASGGAGATSIACNLAVEIADQTGGRCALVDLDFQFGTISYNFDCKPGYTFYNLTGSTLDRSIVADAMQDLDCNVSLLCRPESMEHEQEITSELVRDVMQHLTGSFENVVVDLPRRVDEITATAMHHSDRILLVSQLNVPSVRNLQRYAEMLNSLGIPKNRVAVVINRDGSQSSRINVKDVEKLTGLSICARIPNDYAYVTRSLDFGQPIADLERTSPVRKAIRTLARQIAGETACKPKRPARSRGFLRGLLPKRPAAR
jgi:pilus assembly protein CpaE